MTYEIKAIQSKWLEFISINKNFSKHTVESYSRDSQNFINFCVQYYNGELNASNLKEVDSKTIRSWLAYRINNKYSYSSNNRALSCIKSFFKFLLKCL